MILEPPPLYAIADAGVLGLADLPSAAATMAAHGVGWIQVRAKGVSDDALFALVESCLERLRGSGSRLWINDRPDIAALLPVAGVHLGQDDLPPAAARRALGGGRPGGRCLIGRSTHDLRQAMAADADADVDVIAFGPIFETASKDRPDPVVGLQALSRVKRRVGKPLIAIGGIDAGNLAPVLAAGADTVAVLGAICHGDVARNCQRLCAAAKGVR